MKQKRRKSKLTYRIVYVVVGDYGWERIVERHEFGVPDKIRDWIRWVKKRWPDTRFRIEEEYLQ